MMSLDDFISGRAAGHGALVVLLLAFALGLRHASDPDHLVALSTLVADTRGRAAGALNAAKARRRLARAIPVLGSLALAFGAWYVVSALQAF
jgi:hypothetical protein